MMTTMTETMNMRVRMRHRCVRTTKPPKPPRSSRSTIRIGWGILKMTTPMKRRTRRDDSARALAPHWADPLRAWGDVLMKLDYTKEALKYSPNWKQLKEARGALANQRI
jgi:hypothetical protein